jgi:hypothetical protein
MIFPFSFFKILSLLRYLLLTGCPSFARSLEVSRFVTFILFILASLLSLASGQLDLRATGKSSLAQFPKACRFFPFSSRYSTMFGGGLSVRFKALPLAFVAIILLLWYLVSQRINMRMRDSANTLNRSGCSIPVLWTAHYGLRRSSHSRRREVS